jgi:hypothetical protein
MLVMTHQGLIAEHNKKNTPSREHTRNKPAYSVNHYFNPQNIM